VLLVDKCWKSWIELLGVMNPDDYGMVARPGAWSTRVV